MCTQPEMLTETSPYLPVPCTPGSQGLGSQGGGGGEEKRKARAHLENKQMILGVFKVSPLSGCVFGQVQSPL